ncbi:glutathione S-transferase [Loktanella sp. S4079]|uniref:glutathione S-transferase n=1 Tax=Loktanella sp. S4079 TaxID=579483 RepID=UPI00061FCDF0|nr:glutathione S-transferase [Loktanella sp. S4079]KJZ19452.1 glutathione S-transferase [Loktanella sp. S4079]
MTTLPILWSFRRCPYAMRARLAIQSSMQSVELREIVLRNKPAPFLQASAKGTVPVLQLPDRVIDESRDIMMWALGENDPENWLDMPPDGFDLITTCEGPFKAALDHTKYAVRYPELDEQEEREKAMVFLRVLNDRLSRQSYLMGDDRRLADMAILPFVRQFANTDRDWFDAQGLTAVNRWLDEFLNSKRFLSVMTKYTPWQDGQDQVLFP